MNDPIILRLLEEVVPHLREKTNVPALINQQRESAISSCRRMAGRVGGYEAWVYAENALESLLFAAALRFAEHELRFNPPSIGTPSGTPLDEYVRIRDTYTEHWAQQEHYAMMKQDEQVGSDA